MIQLKRRNQKYKIWNYIQVMLLLMYLQKYFQIMHNIYHFQKKIQFLIELYLWKKGNNEDVGYFNNKISLREENKKNKPTKNTENNNNYCINPSFFGVDNVEKSMKELIKKVKDKYPESKSKNEIRIMKQSIKIEENEYKDKE